MFLLISYVKGVAILSINPFARKGSPFDEQNRLALDRVKSVKSLLGVKWLRECERGNAPVKVVFERVKGWGHVSFHLCCVRPAGTRSA